MSMVLSRIVTLTVGTLYPAYRSYKEIVVMGMLSGTNHVSLVGGEWRGKEHDGEVADIYYITLPTYCSYCRNIYLVPYLNCRAIRTKDVREYVKWMMYWIVFAVYSFVETLADIFISFWFPFYYQLKIVFVIWLLSPWTKGASILYRKWIHPTLSKHENDIDALLEQAKSESYNQLVRLGSRSLLCARDIVAEAALRGQAQLVNKLQRSQSVTEVMGPSEAESRRRIQVEAVKEIIDSSSDNEDCYSGNEEVSRLRSNRSHSKTRTFEDGDNTYNTLPRRSHRRHI